MGILGVLLACQARVRRVASVVCRVCVGVSCHVIIQMLIATMWSLTSHLVFNFLAVYADSEPQVPRVR